VVRLAIENRTATAGRPGGVGGISTDAAVFWLRESEGRIGIIVVHAIGWTALPRLPRHLGHRGRGVGGTSTGLLTHERSRWSVSRSSGGMASLTTRPHQMTLADRSTPS
jgi:hypothetical protein